MDLTLEAKKYIGAGLSPLPVNKDKSPTGKWKSVKYQHNDFKNVPGIGIICGAVSGNLECFDFDNHFGDAKKTLTDFYRIEEVKEIFDRYKFPVQFTQSGGYHLLYRCRKIEGNKKLAQKNREGKPDAIIETRGEGGYFVSAPTDGYKVIKNLIEEVPEITEEERGIMIMAAKSFNEWQEYIPVPQYENEDRPGDYYNNLPGSIEDAKNSLIRNGWKNIKTYFWTRPGKSKGISATFGKVAENVFYPFTSNGHPFDPERGYKPFQVVGLLDYNGDFSKFAKYISDKYGLNSHEPYQKQRKQERKDTEMPVDQLDGFLDKSYIDVSIDVEKPPVIFEINHNGDRISPDFNRLFTLGNFSCFTGKSKSKKTFLITHILSVLSSNYLDTDVKFSSSLPEKKRIVLHFDTEQSYYDAHSTIKRVHRIAGKNLKTLNAYGLREFSFNERFRLIEHAVRKFKDNLGFVMIDGIADLVKSVNSEEEAEHILRCIMKWTKEYNCHISCILHQNKKDNFATGWLGTQIMKKAEVVISVERDSEDFNYSFVSCEAIRGVKEFPDFSFFIDENGIPVIDNEHLKNNKNNF